MKDSVDHFPLSGGNKIKQISIDWRGILKQHDNQEFKHSVLKSQT